MARNRFWPIVISHASNHLCSLIVAMFFAGGRSKYNNQIISLTKITLFWGEIGFLAPSDKESKLEISFFG